MDATSSTRSAASGATANRAVFFSGLTVVLALAGMLLVPTTIFRSLAGGAIIVVLVSVAASMTLLPAIIALLGDWMNWPWLSRIANLIAFFVIAIGVSVVAGLLTAAGAPRSSCSSAIWWRSRRSAS